jgi:uroporphyrinogen-III synthase
MKIKNILISQPKPENEKNPYMDVAKKHNVKIDFRHFIKVENISAKEFRQQRINILEHRAVILNSKNAVDSFFRICGELRVNVPDDMKYFCVTEAIALYLQKYIVYRKRKIFYGLARFEDLMDVIKKHKDEKFLFPCSDKHQESVTKVLDAYKIRYTKAIIYRTVYNDLSDLTDVWYDMVAFFSPMGIESLFHNFPNFVQGTKVIAAFGDNTKRAAEEHGLRVECYAPTPEAPSMAMAIDLFLARASGKNVVAKPIKSAAVVKSENNPKISDLGNVKNVNAMKPAKKKKTTAAAKPAAKEATKPSAKKAAAKSAAKKAAPKKAAAKPAAKKAAPKKAAAKPAAKKAAPKKAAAKPAAKKAAPKKAAPKKAAAKPAAKKAAPKKAAAKPAAKKAAPKKAAKGKK